jgi:hypothetical protein
VTSSDETDVEIIIYILGIPLIPTITYSLECPEII